MQKEIMLKSFGTGQITLPKKWREKFDSPYFRALVTDQSIIIKPVQPFNWDDVEEVDEDIVEPGYTSVLNAKELGYERGIPAELVLKALRELREEEDGQN